MDRATFLDFLNSTTDPLAPQQSVLGVIGSYCEEMGKSVPNITKYLSYIQEIPTLLAAHLKVAENYYKHKFNINEVRKLVDGGYIVLLYF